MNSVSLGNAGMSDMMNQMSRVTTSASSNSNSSTPAIKQEQKDITNHTELTQYMKAHPGYVPTKGQEEILEAVEAVEEVLNDLDIGLQYEMHEPTNRLMISVVNKENGEVIKEIPSEKLLDLAAAMCERAGIFVDEKI